METELRGAETASGDCSTRDELRAFVIGDVAEGRLEFLADHVESCAACGVVIAELDRHQDELVSSLARLPERVEAGAAGVPDELLAIAAAARCGTAASASELILDPGRKIACSLEEGSVRLGRFELVEELGVGSFGHVFRAYDTELDRTVAIKVQRASVLQRDGDHERFLREARSAAQLEHPHIVSLYETGETRETDEGVAYLVTDYIDGQTLEERLRGGPLPPDDAWRLVVQVALALDSAHRHGVVHRDVKPSNIMLDCEGEPHVMNFGLAKRDIGETTVTPEGALMGTPAYMSPEIARGAAHSVDARSDVYSLGVVFYEILTGERPPLRGREESGPYRVWWHEHRFEERGASTRMLDTILYRPPLGPLGVLANKLFISDQLGDIFR